MIKKYISVLSLVSTLFINYSSATEKYQDSHLVLDQIYQYENRVDNIRTSRSFSFLETDIATNTDLCEIVKDKFLADSMVGTKSMFFVVNDETVVFRVYVGGRCSLRFSKRHSSGVSQGSGDRWWATFNDVVVTACDSIYVNENSQLICAEGSRQRVVNLGILHLLTQRKECFRSSRYGPHFRDEVQDIASDLSVCMPDYLNSINDDVSDVNVSYPSSGEDLRQLLEHHLIVRDI